MKNAYEYYRDIIKPIEKKYMRMCTLYSIFKYNYFRIKRDKYNNILKYYYKSLLNNKNSLNEIQKYFENIII